MNQKTQELLDAINLKFKDKPLIYFSREAERGLGLENVLENYHLCNIENHYILSQLKNNNFCSDAEEIKLDSKATLDLINNPKTQEWIKNQTKTSGFYAQFFQLNPPMIKVIENLGGEVLNNNPVLNRKFEDKINQLKVFQENNIQTPKGIIVDSSKTNYQQLNNSLGEKFVIQLDRAHTGTGTFVIKNEEEWTAFEEKYKGNIVRALEFIEGEAYTINGCIYNSQVYVSGLQYQITGIPELTNGKGSTVGNDWIYPFEKLSSELIKKIGIEVKKIGEFMKKDNYKGLFGIDFIIRDEQIFVIEINARQTANIAMQTKLELIEGVIPLLLIHLAAMLDLEIEIPVTEIVKLNGAQVFLRSKKDNQLVDSEIKSGIYRLQSDNSSIEWKKNEKEIINLGKKDSIILLDEEGDKPLVWQREGYCIDQIDDGGFVLFSEKENTIKNQFEEVARMQLKQQVIIDGKLQPWILDAMKEIENLILKK